MGRQAGRQACVCVWKGGGGRAGGHSWTANKVTELRFMGGGGGVRININKIVLGGSSMYISGGGILSLFWPLGGSSLPPS